MNESNSNFPSGPWTGFFTYNHSPEKTRTDLILEFTNGRITGEGNDWVGPFVIDGNYDVQTNECYWLKLYVGQHSVFYRGFREGKGIWGTWEISNNWRGGFHIWPVTEENNELEANVEEEPMPANAFGELMST